VPTLPPRLLGYEHPAGEVHIANDTLAAWYACPGDENGSTMCTDGAVPSLLQGNGSDHVGPYGGVIMGTDAPCVP
jgi:hypothetical protein